MVSLLSRVPEGIAPRRTGRHLGPLPPPAHLLRHQWRGNPVEPGLLPAHDEDAHQQWGLHETARTVQHQVLWSWQVSGTLYAAHELLSCTCSDSDGILYEIDISTGTCLRTLKGHSLIVTAISVSCCAYSVAFFFYFGAGFEVMTKAIS